MLSKVTKLSTESLPNPVFGIVAPGTDTMLRIGVSAFRSCAVLAKRNPGAVLTDTANYRNPNYHRPGDLPDTPDYEFLSRNAALVVASAVALAEDGLTMTRRLRTSSLCWALGIAISSFMHSAAVFRGGSTGLAADTAGSRPFREPKVKSCSAGLALFAGGAHLFAGVGGGIGFRYDLGPIWTLYTEAKSKLLCRGKRHLCVRNQRTLCLSQPDRLGIRGARLFVGEDVRILDSADATLVPPLAFAVTTRIVIAALCPRTLCPSALTVDVGCGMDTRSRCALALSVNY